MKFISDITVNLIRSTGGDHMVVAAARVSTSGEEAEALAQPGSEEGNEGLIRYLMKQRHGTPFEHGSLTFFVHAPIFVFREWHRHRVGFSYNEESGRYKELKPVFWIPRVDRKLVPVDAFKPSRPMFQAGTPDQHEVVCHSMRHAYSTVYSLYQSMMTLGIAKEVARAVLPVGIYSSCWVTTNPRALMHFLSLRTHDATAAHVSYPQAEIEEAARACESMFAAGWPITYKAFCDNGRQAP